MPQSHGLEEGGEHEHEHEHVCLAERERVCRLLDRMQSYCSHFAHDPTMMCMGSKSWALAGERDAAYLSLDALFLSSLTV